MLLRSLLGVAAAVAAVSAETATTAHATTSDSTESTTAVTSPTAASSKTAAQTHTVAVGAEGFKYSPAEVKNASTGDIVEFHFYPGGHTVVRAEYGYPCIPYELTGANKIGFYSGQIAPQVITSNLPTYQVKVNDTSPIFFYCSAPGSCINQHMVGVINPNATQTLNGQMAWAENATLQLAPGEPWPSESLSPTASPTTSNAPAAATNSSSAGSGSSTSLGPGPIAGIAIGAAAVLVLAGVLVYLCGRKNAIERQNRRNTFQSQDMTEGPFYGHGPKSPGQATFGSYRHSGNGPNYDRSPSQAYYSPSSNPSSSAGHQTVYQPLHNQPTPQRGSVQAPLMGSMDHPHYDNQGLTETPHPSTSPPPAELPASSDPGNSPLPNYQSARQLSWSQGAESQYRPSVKS